MAKFNLFNFNRSSKQEQVPVNKGGKVQHFSSGNSTQFGLDAPKYDYSKPYINETSNSRWVPFGEDNLYPYILLDMYQSSPFHSAVIEYKTRVLLSGGLEITGPSSTLEEKLALEKVKLQLNKDYIERLTKEYLIHQRLCFFVKHTSDTKSHVELIGAEKVRNTNPDKIDSNGYFVSKDWRKRRGSGIEKYYPAYDRFAKDEDIQVKVFQSTSPGQDVYAIPSYSTAANWIWLDGQIAFFQKQNMENSINPSAIIKLYQTFASDEEERDFVHGLQNNFASARNTGKTMVFVANSKETAPDIEIMEANKLDRAFSLVQTNIVSNVAYAHLINPVLMGIQTSGKLGVTQELLDSFLIFNNIYIKPIQEKMSEYLTELIKIQGYKDIKVKLINNTNFLTD